MIKQDEIKQHFIDDGIEKKTGNKRLLEQLTFQVAFFFASPIGLMRYTT